ncbi:MAG: PLP-dependent aminotransferase family protein [Thermodesulfobacteriota bacterium]
MGKNFQYTALADEMARKIEDKVFLPGERLPSLRETRQRTGLSVTTVYKAYIEMESRGLVEARDKSGFYVASRLLARTPRPVMKEHGMAPRKVMLRASVLEMVHRLSQPGVVRMGCALPDEGILPSRHLGRAMKELATSRPAEMFVLYAETTGMPELKREIAKLALHAGRGVSESDVVVTNGCMEALNLCLRAAAGPGEVVAVESPTYFGLLETIADLGMYALEVPTDPETGISLPHLARALDEHQVKALVTIPNFHNPLGALMPIESKRELLDLAARKNLVVIEDDVYGEQYYGDTRPATLYSMDTKGRVMYCSSFSKTLSPALRIGWTLPGAFLDRVSRHKSSLNVANASAPQLVLARYLKDNAYERHLRRLRGTLKKQAAAYTRAVEESFGPAVRVNHPRGGMLLWVEMEEGTDAMELYRRADEEGISILPGSVCSLTGSYRNCIRLNCGVPLDNRALAAVRRLGQLAREVKARSRVA